LLWVRGIGDAWLSSEDLRAAPLSLSVTRDEAELEEFELFMQFSSADGNPSVYLNLGSASRIMKRISIGVVIGVLASAEKEIETAFVSDEDKTELSKWLNNGTPEKPGDLGYWVGYRIVKSYYQHATDKRRAFRSILEMTDPKVFLAKSG
jgi:hypothetical protein